MGDEAHGNAVAATLTAIRDRLGGGRDTVDLDPSLRIDGSTCLVTGATSGLGKGTAVDLARRGARVLVGCRSQVPEIAAEIARLAGGGEVEALRVDLSDLASVDAFCDQLAERGERLDVTVLNAGLMPRQAYATAQGFEVMFGVNYFANVVLTRRLLADGVIPNGVFGDGAAQGRRPRIVFVSSEVHRSAAPLDFERLGAYVDYGLTDGMKQYCHSKLATCTYATELARRLAPDGDVDVAVHALCPGPVDSKMARDAPAWIKPILVPVMKVAFLSPDRAAVPVVYLGCADEIEGETGRYLHMRNVKPASELAVDAANGAAIWEANERLLASRVPPA